MDYVNAVTLHGSFLPGVSSSQLRPNFMTFPMSSRMALSGGDITSETAKKTAERYQKLEECLARYLEFSYSATTQSRIYSIPCEKRPAFYAIDLICQYAVETLFPLMPSGMNQRKGTSPFPPMTRMPRMTRTHSCPTIGHNQIITKLDFQMESASSRMVSPDPTPEVLRARMTWQRTIDKIRSIVHLPRMPRMPRNVRKTLLPMNEPVTHMHTSRWLELLDPQHRYGGILDEQFKVWENLWNMEGKLPTTDNRNLFTWINDQPETEIPHVQYLPPEARADYELQIEKGGICKIRKGKGKVLHTKDVGQPHIFVLVLYQGVSKITLRKCQADGKHYPICSGNKYPRCFVGPYERGYFHHSTLAGGAPVLAAGEIIFTKQGKIHAITDKTGHYQIGEIAMRLFGHYLQERSINMDHVLMTMDCAKQPFTKMRDSRGMDFLKENAQVQIPPPLSDVSKQIDSSEAAGKPSKTTDSLIDTSLKNPQR